MNSDTIEIWHGNIVDEEAYYQDCWRVLDAAEQARATAFKFDLLRQRYVVVHGRLRNILAQTLNEPPEKIKIITAEYGKPSLQHTPELAFNLSHSAEAVVIALGWRRQLGVDIEKCTDKRSLDGLVDRCFAGEEIAYWRNLPEAQKTVEFYRFWTRKEAFVKATGRGIALGLDQCVVNPEKPDQFLRVPEDCGSAASWRLLDITLGAGVCSALVTDKSWGNLKFTALF